MKKGIIVLAFCVLIICLSGCHKLFGVGHCKETRAYYTIEGAVVDKEGNPMEGKEIVLVGLQYDTPEADIVLNVWPFDTLLADNRGHYQYEGYSHWYEALRVTTLDYLNEISKGCTRDVPAGHLVIPLEWGLPYVEVPSLTFTGALEKDEENYPFHGYCTVEMPDFAVEE